MHPRSAVGVIPARFASTRFPGKLLAELGGDPVLLHVIRNAQRATRLSRVVVATDHDRLAAVADASGAEVFRSREPHPTGTDRVGEAARALGLGGSAILVLQGDEPFLGPGALDACLGVLEDDPEADIATLAREADVTERGGADAVNVVLGRSGRALYFSRSPVPWSDDPDLRRLHHIGVYAFRAGALDRFLSLPRGRLEVIERLEQLRALEGGMTIAVGVGDYAAVAIDSPRDLARAQELWAQGCGKGIG